MFELIKPFLPPAELSIRLLWPIMIIALSAAAFSGWLRVKKDLRVPYTRKIFHFLIFSLAGILQYRYGLQAVSLLGAFVFLMVVLAVLAGDRIWFYQALARPNDAPHQKKFIILPLLATAMGGVLSNIFFPQTAFIGYFVGGWGDAVGEPVGSKWGKHKYTVPTLFGVKATRSIEGSTAVFLVSSIISAYFILQITSIQLLPALAIALLCGLAAALVEAISSHGLDNLTIQLTAAGVLHYLIF
jgi:phytol kinase